MNTMHETKHGGRGLALRLMMMVALLAVGACDYLDPTQVENPRTTADDLAQAEEPTAALVPGLRAGFARLVNTQGVLPEVVSDNYSIHGTGLSGIYDFPALISPSDVNSTGDATGLYWHAQELKALANFVLDEIVPEDETATASAIDEAYYYRGMAYLALAENFSAAPLVSDGPAVPRTELLSLAIADLEQATGFGTQTTAALARAYRWAGNAAAATSAADQALGADPTFVFLRDFDAASIENTPWAFLVSRALQEMQPLPRLDFLDPKYLIRTQGIAVAKAEEMHLIKAEAALAGGNLATAAQYLSNAVALAQSRSTEDFIDDDPRLNADLTVRPRDAEVTIAAEPGAPFRSGLVQDRPATVTAYTVAGTSLDADSVAALTDETELWHALWLARQEMFLLEGRRMADLGIRLPIMNREIDANPNIAPGDPGTETVVPSWIPAENALDTFSPSSPYDADENLVETEVVMTIDMNRVLAENPAASPFN